VASLHGKFRMLLSTKGFAKPKQYLGAAVKEWIFPDESNKEQWALSAEQFIKEAIRNIE
jgi:hypothetical protein